MTVAPARPASWTASEPTPPAAPEMTTVSPFSSWTECTAPHAVTPATYKPPATSHETFFGLRVRFPASTRTSSAWEARFCENPITSSRGENPTTPAPTSSMTPARSLPCPDGNVEGNMADTAPVRIAASLGVDAGRLDLHENLSDPGHRAFDLVDPQHVDSAELVVPDCLCHNLCISVRLEFAW